eukprot:1393961-Amorphochlora_amoeboformis.AAC.2
METKWKQDRKRQQARWKQGSRQNKMGARARARAMFIDHQLMNKGDTPFRPHVFVYGCLLWKHVDLGFVDDVFLHDGFGSSIKDFGIVRPLVFRHALEKPPKIHQNSERKFTTDGWG